MEGNTMNPDPVDHFVNDVFIAFEDMAIPVIRFSGDDKNLMAESNPFLAKGGDGEILGVIVLTNDEDFHSDGP